ncbi:hypothetical protein V2J09_015090 [Rumex salicifolius]
MEPQLHYAFMLIPTRTGPETEGTTSLRLDIYYIFGSTPISWSSKKQKFVARSSIEAEYKALADTTSEIIRVSSLFKELRFTITDQPFI